MSEYLASEGIVWSRRHPLDKYCMPKWYNCRDDEIMYHTRTTRQYVEIVRVPFSFQLQLYAIIWHVNMHYILEPALANVPVSGELLQHATVPFLESRLGRCERFHPFEAYYKHSELCKLHNEASISFSRDTVIFPSISSGQRVTYTKKKKSRHFRNSLISRQW